MCSAIITREVPPCNTDGGQKETFAGRVADEKKRHYDYAFTNYGNLENYDSWIHYEEKSMKYLVFQYEIGEKRGRFHQQGYIEFIERHTILDIKKMFPQWDHVHWSPRYSTRVEAKRYCMKEETRAPDPEAGPWEFGEWDPKGHQGENMALADCVEFIKQGYTINQLLNEYGDTVCKYLRSLRSIKDMVDRNTEKNNPESNKYPDIYWLHSDCPIELAEKARKLYHKKNTYIAESNNLEWFDDYEGEECVIVDLIDHNCDVMKLIRLCTVEKVKRRGRDAMPFHPECIIFTALDTFNEVFKFTIDMQVKALRRVVTYELWIDDDDFDETFIK